MKSRTLRVTVWTIGFLVLMSGASNAANLNQAIADAEGRRKAAESGVKAIKGKNQSIEQLRQAYTEAANQHNAWLDLVSKAVQQKATTPPDVTAAIASTSTAFATWVAARNRALGEMELAGAAADAVKKKVSQDLTTIAAETWKSNKSADDKKRASVMTTLGDRLRWKSWDQLQ